MYCRVLVQLLRNGSTWMFLKLCVWPLKASDAWCLCQKDGGTQRKQQKTCSFGQGILCCCSVAAIPGTQACLDCRSHKNRRLHPCVELFICSFYRWQCPKSFWCLVCQTLGETGLGQDRCCISTVRLLGCAHITVLKKEASVWAGHFRGPGNEWKKLQALGKHIISYESLNPLSFCCYQLTGLFL